MKWGQKPFRYPSQLTNYQSNIASTHNLGINDSQNSIQALGNAIEKEAVFECKYKSKNNDDLQ